MSEHDPHPDQPAAGSPPPPPAPADPVVPAAGPSAAADHDAAAVGDGTSGTGSRPANLPLDRADGHGSRGRSRTALIAALAVLVVAAGAGAWFAAGDGDGDGGSGPGSASGGGTGPSAWGIRWEVVTITEGGEPRPVVAARDGALVVELGDDGRISFTGCNGGSGTGRLADGILVVEDGFTATEMACTGPEGEALMAQDAWLAEFLSSAPVVELDVDDDGSAETLRLTTDQATMELVARGPVPGAPTDPADPEGPVTDDPDAPSLPDPGQGSSIPPGSTDGPGGPAGGPVGGGTPGSPGPAAVWGQRWTITTITSLPSTSRSVGSVLAALAADDGSAPVLDLAAEGRVSFTGCNGGTATARLDGDRLLVDGVVATRRACGGPDGEALMAQDALLAEILESGPTVTITDTGDGTTITLSSDVGAVGATRES